MYKFCCFHRCIRTLWGFLNPRNEQDEESKFEINSQETIIHANNQDKEPYFENPDYQKNYKICYRKSNTQIKKTKDTDNKPLKILQKL